MNDAQSIEQEIVAAGGTIQKDDRIRHNIVQLEQNMRTFKQEHGLPDPECPLTHTFAPGIYARTIFIPKGTLVVGKIHKHAHLNMLVEGAVVVATEDGSVVYQAPRLMTSKAGTKRVLYTYTNTRWTTFHVTEKTDPEEIEEDIIAKSYAELDAIQDAEVQRFLGELNRGVQP
ncbi:MAG: hypothetical protein OEW25_01985 [Nitrospira sp.]|nr:hypothetical protein [Nitrospira sp.]MDH4327379.1 hypothetical protein [Nitrospira sp.]MDH5252068.1 hypothetical protein [Nitrospira sp.]